MIDTFFKDWDSLLRIVVVGTCLYFALIAMLRISGKRALSKMSAFDIIVIMAIGSILGRTLLEKEVSLSEGIVAAGLLIVLQHLLSWLSVRHKWVHRVISPQPTVLFFEDDFLLNAMRQERICKDEIVTAVQYHGLPDMTQVEAVILDGNGKLAVIPKSSTSSLLKNQ